ncbi:hypothetical protein AYO47_01835 [Planctomyces sp. SCGC AG-212-M04]|nr:hypothetical protein AYO47_01835 [Planctomyces sp. SCGC AG-212-M04]
MTGHTQQPTQGHLTSELRFPVSVLLRAFDYAIDARVDPWQFAMSLVDLRDAGFSVSDLRWLLVKGYAEYGLELTVPGDLTRLFRLQPPTILDVTERACLALTTSGASALRTHRDRASCIDVAAHSAHSPAAANSLSVASDAANNPIPIWKKLPRELWYSNQLVKRYRVPAEAQECILEAFQEEGWPACIDDPLPPKKGTLPARRLQDAIKSLNRNRVVKALRFHSNGDGIRVHWEPS